MNITAFDPVGRNMVQAPSKQVTQEPLLNLFSCGGQGGHIQWEVLSISHCFMCLVTQKTSPSYMRRKFSDGANFNSLDRGPSI